MRALPRQWTWRRKLLGNVLPILASLPFWAIWLWRAVSKGLLDPVGLWLLVLTIMGSWIALNALGWPGNNAMKVALGRAYNAEKGIFTGPRWFVGAATPAFRDSWDPHEDVGFLVLHEDSLEFYGEKLRVSLDWASLTSVTRRANIHSFVGIGGWVCIDAKIQDQDVRLLIEPRERNFIVANRSIARQIAEQLAKEMPPRRDSAGAEASS